MAQDIPDEFQIKRKENFEFNVSPVIRSIDEDIVVEFEVKDFCDVTVVIVDREGNILRHLASGVLGKNAPEPFQKNSLSQKVIWDKKNDQGKYLDYLDDLLIRVSLGLRPVFERTLFWSPYKRIGMHNGPRFGFSQEGVFVFDATGIDSLRKYDHDGVYVKTLYPLSKEALSKNGKGIYFDKFPQDGATLPLKHGSKHKSTLFTFDNKNAHGKYETAAQVIAVNKNQIALVSDGVSRMTTNGEIPEAGLIGPSATIVIKSEGKDKAISPLSVAFSKDGKWLYSTGYVLREGQFGGRRKWLPVVMRSEYNTQTSASIYIGDLNYEKSGTGDGQFRAPLYVSVDSSDNVIVADYFNDRIQVFSQEGKFIKAVPIEKPVIVEINPKTNELYVCSWMIVCDFFKNLNDRVLPKFTRYHSIDNPKIEFQNELPFKDYNPTPSTNFFHLSYKVGFDFYAKEPRLWVLPGVDYQFGRDSSVINPREDLKGVGVIVLKEQGKDLVKIKDFNDEVVKEVVKNTPCTGPGGPRQRMFVHPRTGMLYLGEPDCGEGKAFKQIVSLNPINHEISFIKLPFSAEDMCIDLDGFFYLRDDKHVVRFDPKTWKEIPFDYGAEMKSVGFCYTATGGPYVSALKLPATGKDGWYHLGGFAVGPNGDLAVSCFNSETRTSQISGENAYSKHYDKNKNSKQVYIPPLFPGRKVNWEIHIWDKFGKPKYQDAFPGVFVTNGINIDKNDNLYVLIDENRSINSKPYFLPWNNTLVKVKPGKSKMITTDTDIPVPIVKSAWPNRERDLQDGWVENAEWLYGGVGFSGWRTGSSCICWNARPALDLLGRSFAPEIDHYSVAVLDTNGNLILRIGQYGNVDDGKPIIVENGPKITNSIGGDEVALFHAAYVATFSDHRLFISDGGNSRIVSVKLDYHTNHKTSLSQVKK